MGQDIRIISMQTFSNNNVQISKDNSFQSFVYVNKIDVVKVDQNDRTLLLKSSYQILQDEIKRKETDNQPYQTQQTMVVFREIDNSFTQERIEAFWLAKKALFFVTMVNIPICGCESKSACECLLDTEERIKKVFEGKDYLFYYTLEYNEIMIFCQGTDFEEYYKLVMRLNHENLSDGKENYIIDTITLCGFGEEAETINDSKVGAFIKIGFNDCGKTMNFLEENKLATSDKRHLFGLLGRKDTAIVFEEITVAKLYKLLLAIEKQEFITTLSMTLLTKADIVGGLQGSNFNINSINDEAWRRTLTEYTSNLKRSYTKFCEKNSMQTDNVFLRMVDSISSLIASSRHGRLAEDLAVCLWFPLKHFSEFMNKLSQLDLSDHFNWELEFQQCLDVFCQNVMLIENSTVHTNRQFVQIPHYESIAFEMPPKVMAYYTLITQKLLNAFNDKKPDAFCGAMLAPHLVNELEVEPLLCNDSIEPLQFIIVNISEAMLYDPRRTVAILGHEIAHFAGNETRCRDGRRKCIYIYYIYNLLIEFVKKYMDQISMAISKEEIDTGNVFKLAKELSDKIINNGLEYGSLKDKPLKRELMSEVSNLRNKIFNELACDVIEDLITRKGDILFSEDIRKAYCAEIPNDNEYISQLAENFANNAISIMNVINKFDETRHKEMANYEKRVGYLFSETYSDLAMIKVFNISIKDYFNLYRKDLNTYPLVRNRPSSLRDIILLRFVTVCSAAYSIDDICDVANDEKIEGIDKALAEACLNCKDINKMNRYAQKYKLDKLLMKMLCEYLNICANELSNALNELEAAQCLQNEYQWLSEDGHTITDFLRRILNMEKGYADN